MTPVNTHSTYFEFLSEFVKFYAVVLDKDKHILGILQTVINRILSENGKRQADPSLTLPRVIINKSWNVIKLICERSEYMSKYNDEIEEMLK